ncbi:cysteine hydrolase [Thauera linaloolentis]|uniref:Isochorismatase hydrolase n=1 Tax=Thauera linaloolentis (strain DSM 12138 / JCM 21573 / CCUG 41526 / CIP 105981 / IAM 15112 / NBRC 102519 / 47Lol) TaxID=1123367 RepID=N6XZA9_THAL4|nr:cysteine hydrolase family protein [Thauera linaloolentis]ENO84590.1 isochorismatase hydrolase [Thauera linaloolentis 47Lol = DSM 12138]MCM8564229.1 cysteine hydrolase family protein [Thauera linaloolentis]
MNRRELLKSSALAALSLASGVAAAATPAAVGRLDLARSAFVFIEFQNEWLDPAGPLNRLMKDRALFESAVSNSAAILARAREASANIVHAGLTLAGDPDYLVFAGGRGKSGLKGAIPGAGTWIGQDRVRFPEPFTPRRGEFVVAGRSGASVITNSNLDPYLRNNRVDHLYLMGFALHVCVESTLRHAHDLGYEVTVVSDAAPAFTAQQQEHVIEHVIHHFGRSVTTAELLAGLAGERSPA